MTAPAFKSPVELVDAGSRAAAVTEEETLEQIRFLVDLLDNRFQIPGTTQRVGVDALIGLIPVVGDLLSVLMSAYVIYLAKSLNIPRSLQTRMAINVALDAGLGFLPVAGDLLDVAFKANLKNLRLLEGHLHKRRRENQTG